MVAQLTPGNPPTTATIRRTCSQQPLAALSTFDEPTISSALAMPSSATPPLHRSCKGAHRSFVLLADLRSADSNTTDRLPFGITKSQLPLSRVRKGPQFAASGGRAAQSRILAPYSTLERPHPRPCHHTDTATSRRVAPLVVRNVVETCAGRSYASNRKDTGLWGCSGAVVCMKK